MHQEVAEVNGGPTILTDQQLESSDDLFIIHYSLVIERRSSQGMTLDSVTGLYDERLRWYAPSLGAWTSQYPLQYVDGANTYQLVMGHPTNLLDPSGECQDRYAPDPAVSR